MSVKTNGVLFVNKKKEKDSHPDYTGQLNITLTDDGETEAESVTSYRMAGWINTSKAGHEYISFKVDAEPIEKAEPDKMDDKPKAKQTKAKFPK